MGIQGIWECHPPPGKRAAALPLLVPSGWASLKVDQIRADPDGPLGTALLAHLHAPGTCSQAAGSRGATMFYTLNCLFYNKQASLRLSAEKHVSVGAVMHTLSCSLSALDKQYLLVLSFSLTYKKQVGGDSVVILPSR